MEVSWLVTPRRHRTRPVGDHTVSSVKPPNDAQIVIQRLKPGLPIDADCRWTGAYGQYMYFRLVSFELGAIDIGIRRFRNARRCIEAVNCRIVRRTLLTVRFHPNEAMQASRQLYLLVKPFRPGS